MRKYKYDNLKNLSKEQLIKIISDYKSQLFIISEICVDESKQEVSSAHAVAAIRGTLKNAPQYKFYDKNLGAYIDLQLRKITSEEYRKIVLDEN